MTDVKTSLVKENVYMRGTCRYRDIDKLETATAYNTVHRDWKRAGLRGTTNYITNSAVRQRSGSLQNSIGVSLLYESKVR